LFGERLEVDLLNMMYDSVEELVNEHHGSDNFEDFNMEMLRLLSIESPVNAEDFKKMNAAEVTDVVFDKMIAAYNRKVEAISKQAFPVIKNVFQDLADFVQLPVGMGEQQQFLFDFELFCLQFKWDKIIARNALQWIEQEGHVKFSPSSFKPTLVQVIENRISIQLFEKQYPETGFVLQTLLRTYGGILDRPQYINEGMLAKLLQRDIEFVLLQLKQLQQYGMISLEQKANQPVVQFKWNRASAEFMTLNLDEYQARKLAFEDRIQAMRDYIGSRLVTCRNVFLAKYFGEKSPQNCGICDLCSTNNH
jgi:ATP-dependent DNA helicase RecQ